MRNDSAVYRQFLSIGKQPKPQAKSSAQFEGLKNYQNFKPSLQQKMGDKGPIQSIQAKLQKKPVLQIGGKTEVIKTQPSQKPMTSQYTQDYYYLNGKAQASNERIEELTRKVKELQQSNQQSLIKHAENSQKLQLQCKELRAQRQTWVNKFISTQSENKKLREEITKLKNEASNSKYSQFYRSQIDKLVKNVKQVEEQNERLKQQVFQLQEQIDLLRSGKPESKYIIGKGQSQRLSQRQSTTSIKHTYGMNELQNISNNSPQKKNSASLKQDKEKPYQFNKPQYETMIQKAQALLSRENLEPYQLKNIEQILNKAKSALQSIPQKNSQSLEAQVYVYICIINLQYRQKEPKASIQPFLQFTLNFYDVKLEDYFEEKIVLLNNHALYLQKSEPSDAVKLYEQVMAIQERYYSSKDERRALTLNNIACAWCLLNNKLKAKEYFEQAFGIVTKWGNMEDLIKRNFNFYFPGVKSTTVVYGMMKSSLK